MREKKSSQSCDLYKNKCFVALFDVYKTIFTKVLQVKIDVLFINIHLKKLI